MAYAGDVVVVTADQEWIEEEMQKDADPLPDWLFELLTPIKVKATATSMCEGFWFEVESIDDTGVRWYRHGCSQRLQFGKITLDEANDIVVLPWDMVQTTVQDGEEDSKFRQNYALCRLTVCTINTVCRLHRVKPVQEYLGGVPMTVFTLRVGGIGEHQHSKMSHRETFPPPQYAPSTQ